MSSYNFCVICLSKDVYRIVLPIQSLLAGDSDLPVPMLMGQAAARVDRIFEEYDPFGAPDGNPVDAEYAALTESLRELLADIEDQERWAELDQSINRVLTALTSVCKKDEES